MQQFSRKLSLASTFLRQRDFGEIVSILRTKVWYSERAVGLRRDLSIPFAAPVASIPISIRPATPKDIREILNVSEPGISPAERRDRVMRFHLYDAGFSFCFVAVTGDDRPCFIQWVIPAQENRLLRQSFAGLFPDLAENQFLFEGAYTPTAYRGQRIMPAAIVLIAERTARMGATESLTFAGEENGASLKGCERAGFTPYMSRHVVHRLGFRKTRFTVLPSENR
ncbi:MAG: hypothetical protein ACR2OU_08065 [Thermomicrobiales bacterium]